MAARKKTNPLKFYSDGKSLSLTLKKLSRPKSESTLASASSASGGKTTGTSRSRMLLGITDALLKQRKRVSGDFPRYNDLESTGVYAVASDSSSMLVATESIIVEVKKSAELKWLRNKFGLEVVQEGRFNKMLMRVPESGADGVNLAFLAAEAAYKRKDVLISHPNFLRVVNNPMSVASAQANFWNIANNGNPGIPGADSHALAAWTITTGDSDIRVAVLDEGVDTLHPFLKDAVVDEADFVDDNPHSRPDGNDAHGTACAGIICSRDDTFRGLAPDVSLVGVRMAKGDGLGNWISDDFDTADSIDWAWDEAQSDVLSNSWGGGAPTDAITRAFERARTQGRGGLGSVVVAATGNNQSSTVMFPARLPNVLGVGASNQWDNRKTKTSLDGERWGSNFGKGIDLMAPGVAIPTTDIRGNRGYSTTNTTPNFNGTSSACPHVAAAAALILSIRPDLNEQIVRDLINASADSMSGSPKWNKHTGYGRLNTYQALWAARRVQ